MADPRHDHTAIHGGAIALALLGLGLAVHYGYRLAPPEHRADIWNACGAIARVILLSASVWRVRSRLVLLVAAWWACEELLAAGCSVAYIVRPWPVDVGADQCSALAGFDLGRIGMLVASALVLQAVNSYRCKP